MKSHLTDKFSVRNYNLSGVIIIGKFIDSNYHNSERKKRNFYKLYKKTQLLVRVF